MPQMLEVVGLDGRNVCHSIQFVLLQSRSSSGNSSLPPFALLGKCSFFYCATFVGSTVECLELIVQDVRCQQLVHACSQEFTVLISGLAFF